MSRNWGIQPGLRESPSESPDSRHFWKGVKKLREKFCENPPHFGAEIDSRKNAHLCANSALDGMKRDRENRALSLGQTHQK
jgi:hypothetical protein